MGKTLLYNPNDGDVRITSTSEGSPSGKWEKFMEDGYLPIAKVYGYNVTIEPNNVLVNTLPVGSQISNSEINEDKKYKDMKRIKLKASDINDMVKRVIKEQEEDKEERTKEERDWDEREDAREEIYNDIYDILEPVLETLYKKHGENDLIDLDDEISFVIQDWWDAGYSDEDTGIEEL